MKDIDPFAFSVDGGPDAASAARAEFTERLSPHFPPRAIEDLLLVISELVTNAVRHAGAGLEETIDVRVASMREALRVEVVDSEPEARPAPRPADSTGGLGLIVVSALCRDWGSESLEGRKAVWAEYSLESAEAGVP
jgi:two-component sensor histidine kinase